MQVYRGYGGVFMCVYTEPLTATSCALAYVSNSIWGLEATH